MLFYAKEDAGKTRILSCWVVSGQLLCAYNIQLWCPCPSLANLSEAELTKPKSEGCPDPRQLQRFLKLLPCQSTATGELQRARPWGFRERWGPCPQIITTWRGDSCASVTTPQRTAHRESMREQWDTEEARVCLGGRDCSTWGPLELRLRCWQWEEDGGTSSREITSAQAQRCEKGC